jgi:hypothetical protein
MKEKDIKNLGFERVDDNDDEIKYHYYTLEIGNDYSKLCLITNASDEAKDDNWTVSIFDYDSIVITELSDLQKLVEILVNNVKDNGE